MAGGLAAAGAAGKPPAAVPLYSLAYALYYNKKMFADAGITQPPATWDELVEDGKKLTNGGKWGLAIEGANISENIHHAFTFGQQYGGDFFDAGGKPTFDHRRSVAGDQAVHRLHGRGQDRQPEQRRVRQEPVAVRLRQRQGGHAAVAGRRRQRSQSQGMKPDEYGVAPVPFQADPPAGGKQVNSMVAGINMAVFKHTKNMDGGDEVREVHDQRRRAVLLNKAYGSMPPVKAAQADPAFTAPELKVLADMLATTAAPLPQVPTRASSRPWSARR